MRRILVVLLLSSLALLVACGGGDDNSNSQNACGLATENNCGAPTAHSTSAVPTPGALLFADVAKSGVSLGNSDAPTKIDLWVSFRCPHCHDFVLSVLPQIVTMYVKTDKAQITIRNAALGDAAVEAHSAAACANDQGKFWQAFDALYFNFTDNDSDYTRDNINARLAGSGVDLPALDACLDAQTHKAAVLADVAEIKATNFALLPVMIINGEKIDSLQTFAQAQTFIDAHLGQS